ncbi:MAG: hypothetical protein RIE32_14060 [Phycisphaerales bacterium]
MADTARSIALAGCWLALVAAPLATLAACGTARSHAQERERAAGVPVDVRTEIIRAAATEYLMDFSASVRKAADRIASQSSDPQVQRAALLWKLNAIPAMQEACFRADPLAAYFDAWLLAAQLAEFFEAGAGRNVFGDQQDIAIETSRHLTQTAERLWREYVTSEDDLDAEARDRVAAWVQAHPLEDLSFERSSPLGPLAELAPDRGNALQRVNNLDEQVAVLAHQARLVLSDVHLQVRGEAELLIDQAVEEVVRQPAVEELVGAALDATQAAERAASVAEAVPELVREERAIVLDAVSEQRELLMDGVRGERELMLEAVASERAIVLDAVAAERAALLAGIADERALVLRGVDEQRLATLEWLQPQLDRQREEATQDIERLVADAIREADETAHALVDTIMIRLVIGFVIGIAIAVVLAPIVAHAYVRVWPKRSA